MNTSNQDGRVCNRCREFKLRDKFTYYERAKDKMFSLCKECRKLPSPELTKRNPRIPGMRKCLSCLRHLPKEKVLRSKCADCRKDTDCRKEEAQKRKTDRTYRLRKGKEKGLPSFYGITIDQYDQLLRAQGGRCKTCPSTGGYRSLCVDHCHETGRIRGLLCYRCNMALGLCHDDATQLVKLADYLQNSVTEYVVSPEKMKRLRRKIETKTAWVKRQNVKSRSTQPPGGPSDVLSPLDTEETLGTT